MSLRDLYVHLKHMSGKHNQKLHAPGTASNRPNWASASDSNFDSASQRHLEKRGWKKQADGTFHKDGMTIATREIISRLDGKKKIIVDTWGDDENPVISQGPSRFRGNHPVKNSMESTVKLAEQKLSETYAKYDKKSQQPNNVPTDVHNLLAESGYKPSKNVERMLESPKRTESGHTYTKESVAYDDEMSKTTTVVTGYEKVGSSKIWYETMKIGDSPSQTSITVDKPSQGWAATSFDVTYRYDGNAAAAMKDAIAVAERK